FDCFQGGAATSFFASQSGRSCQLVAQQRQIVLASECFHELLVGAMAGWPRAGPGALQKRRRIEPVLLSLAPFVTLLFRGAVVMTFAPSLARSARHALRPARDLP